MNFLSEDRIIILMPVFNDWQAAGLLLADLDRVLGPEPGEFEVLLVDDGSPAPVPEGFPGFVPRKLAEVSLLRLRRNLGHQRAIAAGLIHIHLERDCRAVVVMDADGEDRAEDVPRLMAEFCRLDQRSVVFAARARRLESAVFQFFYYSYRLVHRLLTGAPVRVGNFSILPRAALAQLAVVPEIWNHYAAGVIRARLVNTAIPIARGRRKSGNSRMNFVGLVLHGLSAIFVYADIVGARLFIGTLSLIALAAVILGALVALRMTLDPATRAWATYAAGLVLVILLQAVMISLVAVFSVIGSRVNATFIPVRDCPYFVAGVERLFFRKS
ncbi:MAG: glycosyltransferase [Bryobacterales bacterium]|nr:glycosyltransferase [Bryobacterales bacterium]